MPPRGATVWALLLLPRLLSTQSLPSTTMDALRAQDPFNAEWVTGLLLLVLAIMAWTNLNASRKWRLWIRNMFRMRLSRQALREEIDIRDRAFLGILLASLLIIALYFHQLWQWSAYGEGAAPAYGNVLLAVITVLLAQYLLLRLLGGVVGSHRGLAEYASTGLIIFMLNGMLLFPVVILSAFQGELRDMLLPIGGGIVGLLLLYRWVRGAWVGLAEGVPGRYIILYLCAAEAVPVLLLAQVWLPESPVTSTP